MNNHLAWQSVPWTLFAFLFGWGHWWLMLIDDLLLLGAVGWIGWRLWHRFVAGAV